MFTNKDTVKEYAAQVSGLLSPDLENQLESVQYDPIIFLRKRSLDSETATTRIANRHKLPIIPPYIQLPVNQVKNWVKEIGLSYKLQYTTSEPWLPAATLGGLPVFVNFHNSNADFGGFPVPLRCIVSIEQYIAIQKEIMPFISRMQGKEIFPIYGDLQNNVDILKWLLDNKLLVSTGRFIGVKPDKLEQLIELDPHMSWGLELLKTKQNAAPLWTLAIPQETIENIPEAISKKFETICYYRSKNALFVGISDLNNARKLEVEINSKVRDTEYPNRKIIACYVPLNVIESIKEQLSNISIKRTAQAEPVQSISLAQEGGFELDINKLRTNKDISGKESPELLFELFLIHTIKNGGSDLHIAPLDGRCKVHYRKDGLLVELIELNMDVLAPLVSVVKVKAKLNVADRTSPQDGKILVGIEGRTVGLRVSTVPVVNGESAVLRVIDQSVAGRSIDDLHLPAYQKELLLEVSQKNHGLILVTGPTGSGKTTTLHAWLSAVIDSTLKVITIEDPVELELKGANQIQVNEAADLTFGKILRAVLRQDPDIIMVGEIRDSETAELAIRAALTGHMVLSTLHTNDALRSISRLADLGIELGHLVDSILLLQGQRLIRKLCDCKEIVTFEDSISEQEHIEMLCEHTPKYALVNDDSPALFEALRQRRLPLYTKSNCGCWKCNYSGFKGRTAVMELCTIGDELREAITNNASYGTLLTIAKNNGFRTFFEQALREYILGNTAWSQIVEWQRIQTKIKRLP